MCFYFSLKKSPFSIFSKAILLEMNSVFMFISECPKFFILEE
jgi:hypothetical protein